MAEHLINTKPDIFGISRFGFGPKMNLVTFFKNNKKMNQFLSRFGSVRQILFWKRITDRQAERLNMVLTDVWSMFFPLVSKQQQQVIWFATTQLVRTRLDYRNRGKLSQASLSSCPRGRDLFASQEARVQFPQLASIQMVFSPSRV